MAGIEDDVSVLLPVCQCFLNRVLDAILEEVAAYSLLINREFTPMTANERVRRMGRILRLIRLAGHSSRHVDHLRDFNWINSLEELL